MFETVKLLGKIILLGPTLICKTVICLLVWLTVLVRTMSSSKRLNMDKISFVINILKFNLLN